MLSSMEKSTNGELPVSTGFRKLHKLRDIKEKPLVELIRDVEHSVGIKYDSPEDRYLKVPEQCRVMRKSVTGILSLVLGREIKIEDPKQGHVEDNPYFLSFVYGVTEYSPEFMSNLDSVDCEHVRNIVADLLSIFIKFLENTDSADQDNLYVRIADTASQYEPHKYAMFTDIMPGMVNMFFNTCVLIALGKHSTGNGVVRIFRFIEKYVATFRVEKNNAYFDGWFRVNLEHLGEISERWGTRPL